MSVYDRLNIKQVHWIHTARPPEGFSSRLYHYEPGCESGYKDEDGRMWYRIQCSYWLGDWIETQESSWWKSYGGYHRAIYIVSEELMFLIKLHWA